MVVGNSFNCSSRFFLKWGKQSLRVKVELERFVTEFHVLVGRNAVGLGVVVISNGRVHIKLTSVSSCKHRVDPLPISAGR